MILKLLFYDIVKKGFFYFLGTSILRNILLFFISVIIVRLLSQSDYGSYTYANNIFSIIIMFSGMGVVSGILQFSSSAKTKEEKKAYLLFATKIGLGVNFLIGVIILIILNFVTLPINKSKLYLQYMAFMGIPTLIPQIISVFLRSTFENKKYAIITINLLVISFVLSIIGIYFFQVIGFIIAKYITGIYVIIIGLFMIKDLFLIPSVKLKTKQIKEFMHYSITAMLTNTLSGILYRIDIFLIGLIIGNSIILSEYRVATLIPFALTFIQGSIIMFVYPYFARNYKNLEYVKKNYIKLIKVSIMINGVISFILILFAPLIIHFLFGEKYMNSVLPFRILSIGYFIGMSFRKPAANIVASLKKIKINLYTSIIAGITNIILDIILIYKMGAIGAAISTVSIFMLSAIFINGYLIYYFYGKS